MSKLSESWILKKREKLIGDPSQAGPLWVYGSLFLCWFLDLLPWNENLIFPSALLMGLIFWAIYCPQRLYFLLVFLLGILVDASTGAVFGQNALIFCCVVYAVECMSLRLQWLSGVGQSINLLPVFLLSLLILIVESFMLGQLSFSWNWLYQVVISAVIWPIWNWILSGKFRFRHG